MKKMFVLLLMLTGVLVLTGCDMLGGGGESYVWYDNERSEIHLSYYLDEPTADENGITPIQTLFLMIKYESSEEWEVVQELHSYEEDELIVTLDPAEYGNVELKVIVTDDVGNIVQESPSLSFYLEQPQYIWHFNANFDSWSGQVNFDYGLDENMVSGVIISKSTDGGLTWETVIEESFSENTESYYNAFYYEYEEGSYVYKIQALDAANSVVAEMKGGWEISVSFDDKMYEGTPEIWHVDANYDIYGSNVNIWWDAQGAFDTFQIEKSLDGVTWENIGEVPRFVQYFNYEETVIGDYFYRVSAIGTDGLLAQMTSDNAIRVNPNALIGYFDGWMDGNNNSLNLNWDFVQDDRVQTVLVERSIDDNPFESLGEFGDLKKQFIDENLLPGNYVYRISLLDVDGSVLDTITSQVFEILPPQYIWWVDVNFDTGSGMINFNYDLDWEQLSYLRVSKSTDEVTWEEVAVKDLSDTYNYDFHYFEFEEGTYFYKVEGLNENLEVITNYNETLKVNVEYNQVFTGTPAIYYVNANYDVERSTVNVWWDAQGAFDGFVLEKSLDGETWTEVMTLPRMIQYYEFDEDTVGEYFYRVSIILDEEIIDDYVTEQAVRVNPDALINHFDGWINWDYNTQSIYLDFYYQYDERIDLIVIERSEDGVTFTEIASFSDYQQQFIDVSPGPGTYTYKVVLKDSNGDEIDSLVSRDFTIEPPQYIWNFNAWHDSNTAMVHFDLGAEFTYIDSILIQQSTDGGLTWTDFYSGMPEVNAEYGNYSQFDVYIPDEGLYAFRVLAYNVDGEQVGELVNYNEIRVDYGHINYEGTPEIYNVNGTYDIYSEMLNLWFYANGTFDHIMIEYSTDGTNFTFLQDVPRETQYINLKDLADGDYIFKVSAVDELGAVLHSLTIEESIRVKADAKIGQFNVYYNYWEQEAELWFEVIREDVSSITIERKLDTDTDFTLLGTYGPLKNSYVDSIDASGNYTYRITVYDVDGEVLDQVTSDEYEFNIPEA